MRERLTTLIQRYEHAFCTTFERSDEVWVKVSDTEMVASRRDPTDYTVQGDTNSFPVAEILLRDDEYEVIFDDDSDDVANLVDDQTCIPAPSGM